MYMYMYMYMYIYIYTQGFFFSGKVGNCMHKESKIAFI